MVRSYWGLWWSGLLAFLILSVVVGRFIFDLRDTPRLVLLLCGLAVWLGLIVVGARTARERVSRVGFTWSLAAFMVWALLLIGALLPNAAPNWVQIALSILFFAVWIVGGSVVLVFWLLQRSKGERASASRGGFRQCPHCHSTRRYVKDMRSVTGELDQTPKEAWACANCDALFPEEPHDLVTAQFKHCPFCAEEIRVEAIKCRHCGSMLD